MSESEGLHRWYVRGMAFVDLALVLLLVGGATASFFCYRLIP